ncbi:DoxX family protein [Microbaculum marinum]|uniref:DoxX family protein n=1 Tax=Microbaculum marinum TaxID=1764581 RepID=A0AAW9RVT4_9HYPH
MEQARARRVPGQTGRILSALAGFDRWLKRPVVRWVAAPVQLGLRLWIFFGLPFVNSGLTKWEVYPFLRPEVGAWNGWPQLRAAVIYQFSSICDFCFNIRIWVAGEKPLVQWGHPFPETSAWLAGNAEIILPALILVGLLTRLSALGLLAMTLVIQLVMPTGLGAHATWAVLLLAVIVLGPGLLSVDHLLGRLFRR